MAPSPSGDGNNTKDDGNNDTDYDETPLEKVRPYGSGLHRHHIAFVPAAGGDGGKLNTTSSAASKQATRADVASIYLSMVLPEDVNKSHRPPGTGTGTRSGINTSTSTEQAAAVCEVCKLPLSPLTPEPENKTRSHGDDDDDVDDNHRNSERTNTTHKRHETSLAHQLCLPHSHPPSALDRSRMGLTYLSAYGWDPDSRRGLGAGQQGIPYPVKARAKDDNLGVGMAVPPPSSSLKKEKVKLLDAKKVRKQVLEEKRRAESIRRQLFGRDDLERYLGSGN